jgi:hypothetical protein
LTDKLDDLTQKNLDLALKSTDFNATSNINYVITQNFVEQRNLEMKLEMGKV